MLNLEGCTLLPAFIDPHSRTFDTARPDGMILRIYIPGEEDGRDPSPDAPPKGGSCNRCLKNRRLHRTAVFCAFQRLYRCTKLWDADGIAGLICGRAKPLPFDFPYHSPADYVFLDFCCDEERQTYMMAWAERQEGAAMRVSLYGPEGGLLAEYDTGLTVPVDKVAGPSWPWLVLDGDGLGLVRLDGGSGARPYFVLPADAYQALMG